MSDSVRTFIEQVEGFNRAQKQQIFEAIKGDIAIHALEDRFGISVQVICDAIIRSGDLTQRGVRGVIAETVFCTQIVPKIREWRDATPPGDHPFDVLLARGDRQARIQVKMQRREGGVPQMRRKGGKGPKSYYSVEVQRTRGGIRAGEDTRPYHFKEFDLLAVCMQPSTGDWHSFLYILSRALEPKFDKRAGVVNDEIIATFQAVPPYPATDDRQWTSSVEAALEILAGSVSMI